MGTSSKNPLFDSHFHLSLATGSKSGLENIHGCNCSTGPGDWHAVLEKQTKTITPYLGIHPWNTASNNPDILFSLQTLLAKNQCSGVGEIGLDGLCRKASMEVQIYFFKSQLALARDLKRPMNIHCVKAWKPLIDCLDYFKTSVPPFSIHAFGGSTETAAELVKRGAFVSFSSFTLKKDRKKTIKAFVDCPEAALLLDTDFPPGEGLDIAEYPLAIKDLYHRAAELKQTTIDNMQQIVAKNLQNFIL